LIVDINMMWMPSTIWSDEKIMNMYLSSVPKQYGYDVKLTAVPGTKRKQIIIYKPKGRDALNYTDLHTDPLIRLRDMEKAGVDKALLRHPCWEEWFNLDACRKVNTLMARYVDKHPDKLMGLAIAPPWGDDESLDELDRAVKDLHLSGVECAAHYGELYLDAPELRAYFKKLNQLNVPVVVLHTPEPVGLHSLDDFTNPRRFYGRIIDQMVSVSRILYSGMLDDCPNLKLILTHMGGGLFAFTNFVKVPPLPTKEDVGRFDSQSEKIERYLSKNIYYDVTQPTQWTNAQLECAVKEVGADHMLYGASYPIRLDWFFNGVQRIRSLGISEREKNLILGENAVKLFKIRA